MLENTRIDHSLIRTQPCESCFPARQGVAPPPMLSLLPIKQQAFSYRPQRTPAARAGRPAGTEVRRGREGEGPATGGHGQRGLVTSRVTSRGRPPLPSVRPSCVLFWRSYAGGRWAHCLNEWRLARGGLSDSDPFLSPDRLVHLVLEAPN